MKRSKRMQILVDIAKSKEDQAAKLLAQQRLKLASDKEQLEQLKEYANQYESERNLLGLNANLIANYQHFVTRLEQAVQQQNMAITQAEQQTSFALGQWLEARAKTQSMHALQQKHVKQEEKQEEKREQSQLDEFAMRRYLDIKPNG
ncbi:flagellar export protein FliJ [Marinomonas agarivorans]|nr:flagellar export protein FliJ [Marinomonas agarivorans]